jgi:glyceraldehyde-3-phosphate dehydrogenase/erythrose-4-phosphate dehydrogenase
MVLVGKGGIDFTRNKAKILGNICSACTTRAIPDTEYLLTIDMGIHTATLCSVHEGILLEKLLTNYLKRVRRGSTAGFTEGIPKQGLLPIVKSEPLLS